VNANVSMDMRDLYKTNAKLIQYSISHAGYIGRGGGGNWSRLTGSPTTEKKLGAIGKILTRQAMYVQHNSEACSRSCCCCGNAISITQSEHVSVALVIQYAK
jgi:hypothetical protein